MKRILGSIVVSFVLVVPASADVKISATTSGEGLGQMAAGQSVTYVRGHSMRSETVMGDNTLISIIDLDAQKMFVVNVKKREADAYDLAELRAGVDKSVGSAQATVSFVPNGQKKTVMGHECDGYDLSISMPAGPAGMQVMMQMTGPAWVAAGVDGFDEYAAFFTAAVEQGMFFQSPQQAKAQPAQARGMSEMYRILAATGMPLEQQITVKMEGGGPLGGMLSRVGNMTINTLVTAVSTEPLPDDLFSVPADYKVKNR